MKRNGNVAAACAILAALLCISPGASGEELEWKDGKWVRAPEPGEGTEGGHLALVRELLRQNKGRKALQSARMFLVTYPDSSGREEAMLLAGRAEMSRGRYYQGFEWFEKQLAEFPSGRYYTWALAREFEVAEAFLAGKKRIVMKIFRVSAVDDGLEILLRIAEHAPGTNTAEDAIMRIAEHHNSRGQYTEAVEAYDRFMEMFPKSPRARHAALQAARATWAQFKGPQFDDTPLLEAEQRFRSFGQKYPAEASEANVPRILREITEARAGKLYATGDFYRRVGRNKSAAYYFKMVLEQFAETDWASRAEQALMAVGAPVPAPGAMLQPAPVQPKAAPEVSGTDTESGATK